ncbi:MAG: 50S ribosomal protein L25/general stress protein Ctc [Enterococcus sp.]
MSESLVVRPRNLRPRSLRNQLRHEGQIPAIVNGYRIESTPITVPAKALEKILRAHGTNTVITLELDNKKINTLLRQTQTDTFTGSFIHVSFQSVNLAEPTETEADILLVGDAPGVKAGGVLTQPTHQLLVLATPENLPEHIEIDISQLEIGQSLSVADIPKNSAYTILSAEQELIVSINDAPELPEENLEASEPEVIGETNE